MASSMKSSRLVLAMLAFLISSLPTGRFHLLLFLDLCVGLDVVWDDLGVEEELLEDEDEEELDVDLSDADEELELLDPLSSLLRAL